MNISHIEHLGIAVKSIEEHRPYYENVLGWKCYNIEEVADQKVKKFTDGCAIVKTIVVRDKLVNIIVKPSK